MAGEVEEAEENADAEEVAAVEDAVAVHVVVFVAVVELELVGEGVLDVVTTSATVASNPHELRA